MTDKITPARLRAWIQAMERLAKEKYGVEIETHLGFALDRESDLVQWVLGIRELPNAKAGLAFWDEIYELPEAIVDDALSCYVAWAFPAGYQAGVKAASEAGGVYIATSRTITPSPGFEEALPRGEPPATLAEELVQQQGPRLRPLP